jgi:hypothetical protein
MLKTIAIILVAFWLAGFLLHVAGSLIHILLVLGVAALLIDLFTGRRSAA